MFDPARILSDLKQQAAEAGRNGTIPDLGQAAQSIRTRLAEDKGARTLAAGAGGLLLMGLLGSKGGRKMIGNVAQTGAVAALGAFAYKAWTNRGSASTAPEPPPADLKLSGFILDSDHDAEFSSAIIHAMLGAALADGALDALERGAIEEALRKSGAEAGDLRAFISEMPDEKRFAIIERGARSPNHATEIYAAAVVAAGELNDAESQFLERLADRLRIHPAHAADIRRQALD